VEVTYDVEGARLLGRTLRDLDDVVKKRVIRYGVRKALERLKAKIMLAWADHEDTGRLSAAMEAKRVGRVRVSRHGVRAEWPMPTRVQLGINPDDPYFYPHLVEYGYTHTRGGVVPGLYLTRGTADREEKATAADVTASIRRRAEHVIEAAIRKGMAGTRV
jgi:hypothetical protein